MNHKEYTKFCLDLCTAKDKDNMEVMGALGLAGEAGEVVDCIKKIMYSTFPEKVIKAKENLPSEFGDVLYYFTILLNVHGLTLEDVIENNVNKLNKRYNKNGR
jgi:NTP pyrophosphatase (non-canonical NTP hydrolase)